MTIDPARLRVTVTEGEGWRRDLAVTVPADIVRRERARVMRVISKRVRMPGFRKGRIPARVIERHHGATADRETLDNLLGKAIRAAIRREKLRPISNPEFGDIQTERDQDLFFEVSFDVKPVIEIERVGGFVVERPTVTVGDADVEAVLRGLRERNGAWRPVGDGFPEAGNAVSVEILELDEAGAEPKDYEFILGEGDAIPDVERAIEQLEVGEAGEFVIRFRDDFPDERRRGEERRLRIRLVGRKVLDLPELDDDFAISLDYENLADMEDRARANLEEVAATQAERVVRARLMDFVLDANAFDPPASMVESCLDEMADEAPEGAPPEEVAEMRAALRPRAEKVIRIMLAFESIARDNGLAATEEEVAERIGEIARASGVQPETVDAQLRRNGRIESIERKITEEKVFQLLKRQSEIIETG